MTATTSLDREGLERMLAIVQELQHRKTGRKIDEYFKDPSDGYHKSREFFKAGKTHKIRLFMAANRVGKSQTAGCELVYHLTGQYPSWWEGHRFTTCNQWWAVGDTKETTRKSIQNTLLGPVGEFGTGLIPRDCIDFETLTEAKKADTPVSAIRVKHVNGTWSTLHMMSSEQGRKVFQANEVSVWLDEECPYPVFEEALTRTMTGGNILMMTFTPLQGMSDVVKSFMINADPYSVGETGLSKYVVRATWDDAPHLDATQKAILLAAYAPFQRDARSKGIPTLGAGAIFPVSEESFVIEPFEIPDHWPRAYGFDVGRNTAAAWIAYDRDSGTLYTYSDYFCVEGLPSTHTSSIQARGKWIKGAIDTAARGRAQTDGENLFQMYKDLGLNIVNADKAVESGLLMMLDLLVQGRLKVFKTCTKLIQEFRGYQRNEQGKIVKVDDHVLDAWRYAVYTRDKILRTKAESDAIGAPVEMEVYRVNSNDSWML